MLRITRIEETVKPGNRLVQCSCETFRIRGVPVKFRRGEPVEVTQRQFEYLMAMNATLGRVVFQEYSPKKLRLAPLKQEETVQDIFADLPDAKKAEVIEPDEVIFDEEPEGQFGGIAIPGLPDIQDEFSSDPSTHKSGKKMQILGEELPPDKQFPGTKRKLGRKSAGK